MVESREENSMKTENQLPRTCNSSRTRNIDEDIDTYYNDNSTQKVDAELRIECYTIRNLRVNFDEDGENYNCVFQK